MVHILADGFNTEKEAYGGTAEKTMCFQFLKLPTYVIIMNVKKHEEARYLVLADRKKLTKG